MARFMRKGTTKVYFVPTIAAPGAPTVIEITAGQNLTPQIAAISGFTFKNSPIDTPDMATTFVSKIPGEDAADDSTITFYEDKTASTLETGLAKGLVGYVVFFRKGTAAAAPAVADKCQIWPVIIASNAPMYTVDNTAAQFEVSFACTAPPSEGTLS